MAITFYYLSGSPFSWKVWLSLERKNLSFDLKLLSADAGDLQSPAFREINPRGKVPAIVDDGFVLTESQAILEYLEDCYTGSGGALWPHDSKTRAIARRISAEADNYLYPIVRKLVVELLIRRSGEPDPSVVAEARTVLASELAAMRYRFCGLSALGDIAPHRRKETGARSWGRDAFRYPRLDVPHRRAPLFRQDDPATLAAKVNESRARRSSSNGVQA
jgi:glutathione S-transferase